jgi:hypothetical protein
LGVMAYWMLRLHETSVAVPVKSVQMIYRVAPTSVSPGERF